MDVDVEKQEWERLVRRTHQQPFFTNIRIVRNGHESTLLVESIWPKIIKGLLSLGIGGVMVYCIFPDMFHDIHFGMLVPVGFLLLFSLGVIIIPLMRANRVCIENYRSGIVFRYGSIFFPKMLELYRDQLQVQFCATESDCSANKRGRAILSIQKRNNPSSEILLACGFGGKSIRSAYEELRKFLPSESIMENPSPMVNEEKEEAIHEEGIHASIIPLDVSSASYKTVKSVEIDTNTFMFVPTVADRIFPCIFLGIGVAMIFLFQKVLHEKSMEAALIVGVVCVFSVLTGFILAMGKKKIVADQNQRKIMIRWGCLGGFTKKQKDVYQFDEIIAVQICSGYVQISKDGGKYLAYQLNLVLREPTGERVNLFSHGHGNDLKNDAKRFAEYLNVPLLDHSDMECDLSLLKD